MREAGYPWVGIYDLRGPDATLVAWSGASKSRVSAMVVPVLAPDGREVGRLEAASDLPDAFDDEARRRLEECAEALRPLWA